MSPRLRLIVLSEDTGKHGALTVQHLLRKLLAHVHGARPHVIHQERHDVQWVLPVRPESFAAGASLWKAKSLTIRADQEARREFVIQLTETLLSAVHTNASSNAFVFFHHDGDDRWSTHPACALCTSFDSFVARDIERSVGWQIERQETTKKLPHEEREALVRRAMARLIPVQPHWSIEAWLYGGSDAARETCEGRHRAAHCGEDAHWSVSREALEERAQPKKNLLVSLSGKNCCLTDEFNLELAQRFRAASAVEESPSFGALAEKVRACSDLMSELNALA